MHAVTYEKFGKAADVLTLSEMPDVNPGSGEVRVALHRSGVNPSDVKSRAGSRPGVTAPPFPLVIPHSDGAGVIEAVGADVDPSRIGSRVWIWNGQWQRAFGTAATHITLPATQAVALPDGVSFDTGATLGIPGLTACHAVFGGGDVAGQTLLVSGGGGTVGYLAVQLARWGGARVIATCSARDRNRVLAAGAHVVLDYAAEDLAGQVLAANDGAQVDRILEVEFGINLGVDTDVIAENGTIAAYGSALEMAPVLPFGPLLFKAVTIDVILIYLLPKAERDAAIKRLHAALTDGALTCPVEKVFALADTAHAQQAVEAGGRAGAILIDCVLKD
ncbi:zinc-binding dehydrogenase [Sulfitobacter sp. SK012]|uniref:NADPH:quinone reductase n=1 Tax=Sulfitobacter sp. SK012 TaxID=1389005 RepID=UPI000E0A4948|nr:NADPH:quinone reductase [Sulfitobacter sp. SK012]AXI47836.1 zinc-binding dehydrogenase [Sulfitobacter sp. SK012]